MDSFIRANSADQRIAVSYTSLDNTLNQYHRNANITIPSSELIKAPLLMATFLALDKNSLDIEDTFEITEEEIERNGSGMLGEEDIGKFYSTEKLIESLLYFGDHSAANLLLPKVKLHQYFESFSVQNMYFKRPIVDSLKNSTRGIINLTSSADLVNFGKYAFAQLEKGKNLDELKNGTATATNPYLNLDKNSFFLEESNAQLKGFTFFQNDKSPYLLTIMVMNFKDEVKANKALEEATKLFFDNYKP